MPLSVRKASGFPSLRFKQGGYAAEAKPQKLLDYDGKPKAFRTESGTAAYESAQSAYENGTAVSGVAHSLASKTSSVLSFNMEDVDNE
jgi:hypothetical protein